EHLAVTIEDVTTAENEKVDSKIVRLAQQMDASIITTDYNLNKVADLHGVVVLNINDLAKALKPVFLPGEELQVKLIRRGKEPGQGVGYLDDGTRVVVDEGSTKLGRSVVSVVTSVLQTTAGRMIFARLKK
ncbi:MAG: twitching motility protein PilT, partial [bacterium]